MRIDDRKQRVLDAIVKDYIATAEPVGSRTVARKYNLGVSSATIRNEMADLEEMGFIEQPHTSAGRIPSQQGYRYYVDFLMAGYALAEEEAREIRQKYLERMGNLEQIVQDTSKLLSQFTNYTAIVLGPLSAVGRLAQMELIPTKDQNALLIVVTEAGAVFHRILELRQPVSAEDLYRVSQVINAKIRGTDLTRLQSTVLRELYAELPQQRKLMQMTLEILDSFLHNQGWEKVYIGGVLNILNQPEFRNVDKIRQILGVLEEQDEVRNLLTEDTEAEVSVRIGEENRREEFQDCSVITVTYKINGASLGRVGLLGPTRMEYPRAQGVLEFVASVLSEALQGYYQR